MTQAELHLINRDDILRCKAYTSENEERVAMDKVRLSQWQGSPLTHMHRELFPY